MKSRRSTALGTPGVTAVAVGWVLMAGIAFAQDAYPDPVQCQSWCQGIHDRCRAEGQSSCEISHRECMKDCVPLRTPDRFGAIAYDAATKAVGFSTDYGTRAEADQRALSECRSSRKGCAVVVRFTDGCAALAIDSKSRTWGWGRSGLSKDEAEFNAITGCADKGGKDCRREVSICNQAD